MTPMPWWRAAVVIDSTSFPFKLRRMGLRVRFIGACVSAAFSLATTRAAFADLAPAREALLHGDTATAEPLLRSARGGEREQADRWLGRLLLDTGRTDDARALGERLSRVPATRVDGLTLEGEALAARGEYDQAVQRWTQAVARNQPGVGRRARALAGQWLTALGRRQEAQDLAQPLIDEYNDAQQEAEAHPDTPGHLNPRLVILRDAEALTYLGMAMRALGFFQDANQAFNEAVHADPHAVDTLLESAELYLSKEDMGHAGDALREALAVNPHSARALALRARTRLMNDLDFVHANEDLDAALLLNPNLPEAYALRAQIVLRDGAVARADALLDRAIAFNPRHLESLATRAVVRFEASDADGVHRALDATFAVSPVYVDAYALLGDFADWEHRYAEAVALMREGLVRPAVAADPRLQGRLRAQLGMNLLRMGDETAGLPELQESFRRDRYNVRVFNLLNLYEETLAHDYGTETAGPFVIRYANDEHAILARYVPQLLQRAYRDMVARYHFTPEGPLSIELYNNPETFSVRTAGLPEIGVQGVCFGKVITALSPAGGPYNWGQILWHELGHVFAIQLSHSRVPRWFTEGLSEWEAFHSHPQWAREDDGNLYRAMQANRVPHVADFNTAFTHARSGDDMLVAYYAASKLLEFMIDRYGFDRIVALLPRWGAGHTTVDVIQQGLGVSAEDLDRAFRAFTMERLSPRFQGQFGIDTEAFSHREDLDRAASGRPTDAVALARAAVADLLAGEGASARQHAEAALAIDPAQPLGHFVLARVALSGHDGIAALAHLDAMFAARQEGYELRVLEARAAQAAHNDVRVRAALEAATRQDPTQSDAWELLATLHEHAHRPADQLAALRHVVQLDQHNRPALRSLLAALQAQSQWAEMYALLEHGRNLDPEQSATHVALGRAAAETNHRDDAIYEYESAVIADPEHPEDAAGIHVALARLYLAAGNRASATEAVRHALQAQPTNADARTLAQQLSVH